LKGRQVSPAQQPLAQLDALHCWVGVVHAPAAHAWPVLHAAQVPPSVPQADVADPVWHAPFSSQHPEQLPGPHFGKHPKDASTVRPATAPRMIQRLE
jgi:hypothetical protein